MGKWFMAVLVRGSHLDGVLYDGRLGDLLYRLIQASDADAAYEKALHLGEQATDTYSEDDGNTYELRFLGLADLTEIQASALDDGVEVYSQILPGKPSEMVVEREELTVFEPNEDPASDPFASDPITPK